MKLDKLQKENQTIIGDVQKFIKEKAETIRQQTETITQTFSLIKTAVDQVDSLTASSNLFSVEQIGESFTLYSPSDSEIGYNKSPN